MLMAKPRSKSAAKTTKSASSAYGQKKPAQSPKRGIGGKVMGKGRGKSK